MADAPSRRMTPLLEAHGLTRRYAGLLAVDAVDLMVREGGVHGVIGPNGAGKTTLFNLLSGITPPSSGRISLGGQDITRLPPHRRAALGMARTFQSLRVAGGMTVLENVLLGLQARPGAGLAAIVARLPRFRREEAAAVRTAEAALQLVGLASVAAVRAGELSYGEGRRVEIARAVVSHPRLLLLDEPAAGLNPAETAGLATLVRQICAAGTSVLLVEHDMGLVMQLSDEITVLNFGRRIANGPPAAIRSDPAVIEAYLGHKVAARLQAGAQLGVRGA